MNLIRPLGLDEVTTYIEKLHPLDAEDCHFIIYLDTGNGQSALAEYMTDVFWQNRLRHFGGRDRFLEYKMDGNQLKQVLSDIDANRGYTNNFEGMIFMDISGFSKYVHEAQAYTFLKAVQEMGKHATLIFFCPTVSDRNLDKLILKLREVLVEVEEFRPKPYTAAHITGIILRMLNDSGVLIERPREVSTHILEMVRSADIHNIKDAKKLTRQLRRCADHTGMRPTLSLRNLCPQTEEAVPQKAKEAI